MLQELLFLLDLLGIVVFSMTGALIASKKNMDIFGMVVLGVVTAIGGGTFRDLVLGVQPVFWVESTFYLYLSVAAACSVFWLARVTFINSQWMMVLDAVGLAAFAVLGTEKALSEGAPLMVAVIMGVISGCFGGMIRDVLAGEVPYILRKEIYATACLSGCMLFGVLSILEINSDISLLVSFFVILFFRLWGIYTKASLPVVKVYQPDKDRDNLA